MVKVDYTGSDLSGLDGDANRVLTLSNSTITVSTGFQVFVDGLLQTLTTDYTITHNNPSTVTLIANTYNDSNITVIYNLGEPQAASTAGKIPLNARFIQKNIGAVGDTCTVTNIAVTIGTDEYRTVSEVDTDNTSIPCFVNVLSYEDEIVKSGDAKAGDLRFWFDSSYNSYFSLSANDKIRISWNSGTYEVVNIMPFKAVGNTLMLIEVIVKQI